MKKIALSLFFCGLLISADDYLVIHVNSPDLKAKPWKSGADPVGAPKQVPAGTNLSGPAGGDLIVKCGPDLYYSYSCSKECKVPLCQEHVDGVGVHPINLHQHTEGKTGFLDGLFAALFVRAPVLPVVAASRAGGNPNDAVILQRGAEIHWGPALRRVVEDTYCFQLKRLPSSGEVRDFSLAWDSSKDAEGIARLPNLKPGAYELAKGSAGANGACRLDEDGLPAWVVLATESEFARANTDWKGYRDSLADLEKAGAAPSLLLAVRRAALSGIADSVEGR
jgi:hypothetical protein